MEEPAPREAPGPAERQPLEPDSPWWTVHLARYRYAARFVRGGRVLDIACGTGYGLSLLAEHAWGVGVDVDASAAAVVHGQTGERVLVGDGRKLPFHERSFDAVVSFETIEHLHHRGRFLAELARVLTDSGTLILSTPNANHTRPIDGRPRNPFHVHEYTPEELASELSRHFGAVSMMGQVLDSKFRLPPFWDEQEALTERGDRARVLAWRALSKLPECVGNAASRWIWQQPLYPAVEDYLFLDSEVERAPVLVALCKRGAS